MPISVARKVEYFQRSQGFDDLDIRLQPIVLTADQVETYSLPRVPVKDSDRRKAGFEAAFGAGQVELDALEALHPGELAGIVEAALLDYHDPDLRSRAEEQRRKLAGDLADERRDILTDLDDDLEALRDDYADLRGEFAETRERFAELVANFQTEIDAHRERLHAIKEQGRELYGKLYERLEDTDVDVADYPLPEPDLPPETNVLLYDSTREYFEQLGHYKTHRHGTNGDGVN